MQNTSWLILLGCYLYETTEYYIQADFHRREMERYSFVVLEPHCKISLYHFINI